MADYPSVRVRWRCQPVQERRAVVEPEGGLGFAVVVLDAPAALGQAAQLGQGRASRTRSRPSCGLVTRR